MKKVVRLTESDLVRIVRRVIREQHEEELDEQWGEVLGTIAGPLGAGIAALFGDTDAWQKYVKYGSKLFGVLSTETGKTAFRAFLNSVPTGVIKNMAIAAARGDAQNLTQSFEQSKKYVKYDLSQIKNAAFQDMKNFGNLLLKVGVGAKK